MSVIKLRKKRICFATAATFLLAQILFSLGKYVRPDVVAEVGIIVNGVNFLPNRIFGPASSSDCSEPSTRATTYRHHLAEDERHYFTQYGDLFCFNAGIDPRRALLNDTDCRCLPGWYGVICSAPAVVYFSNIQRSLINITTRAHPRRIINAFPFNAEFEMLEARLGEIGDLVDVFVVLESNYTMFGRPKPRHLAEKMKRGYLAEYWCKIVYIFLDYFPGDALNNGWIIDDLLRNHVANKSINSILTNVRDDDVYLQTDADEIPNRASLLFLKNHHGFPSVTGFHLRNTIFGFFWLTDVKPVHIILSTTVGFLREVFKFEAIKVRSANHHINDVHYIRQTMRYERIALMKTNKTMWSLGNAEGLTAGWHCTYCCKAECVRSKMLSAPNSDLPRWGSKAEKIELGYIKSRINRGMYFDNKRVYVTADAADPVYAPSYVLKNPAKFYHILELPWADYKNASWRSQP